MKRFHRYNKTVVSQDVPGHRFAETYDIIVVGLGTAGALAAISAAKRGHKVLGLERLNCMGGTGTAGTVQGYYFGSRGGEYERLDEQVAEMNRLGYTRTGGVNGELKKYVLEQGVIEAGAAFHYEASVISVYVDGNRTVGVQWLDEDGIKEAGASIIIDCSGEAEIAAMAGGAFRLGRESDGLAQPFSNVIKKVSGTTAHQFYTDSGYVDPTDADSVTAGLIESALRTTHLKSSYTIEDRLAYVAPQLGIREGRFIDGIDNVFLADVLEDRLTKEPVFYAYSNLDNHSKDVAFESETYQDWIVAASLWGVNFSVPIPLGALIPKQLDGLLVAGRCIALDHDMATCVRMKRDMQKCGEAAAAAASLSLELGVPVREVPYAELAALLRATGCLDERNNVGLRIPGMQRQEVDPEESWLTDKSAIRQALAGDKPGIAIWSAKRLGASINAELKTWLAEDETSHLSRHSAFALALQGDRAALPLLRQMATERDRYVPSTSRKYNQVRGYTAIYLLGKLADGTMIGELTAVMNDRDSFTNASTDVEFINSDDEYYFQYLSFSMMALFRIGDAHPHTRSTIADSVKSVLRQEGFSLSISLKPSKDQFFEMADNVRRVAALKLKAWGLAGEAGALDMAEPIGTPAAKEA